MALDFRWAIYAETVRRLSLDHLFYKKLQIIKIQDNTLLIKSAASNDQPSGISCLRIYTRLASIWSRISLRDLPRYGR
jgi:hypothetical protein